MGGFLYSCEGLIVKILLKDVIYEFVKCLNNWFKFKKDYMNMYIFLILKLIVFICF